MSDPPRTIERYYAWVVTMPDGNEAVSFADPKSRGMLPLAGADKALIENLRWSAEDLRRLTGYPVRLVEFSGRTVLEELP